MSIRYIQNSKLSGALLGFLYTDQRDDTVYCNMSRFVMTSKNSSVEDLTLVTISRGEYLALSYDVTSNRIVEDGNPATQTTLTVTNKSKNYEILGVYYYNWVNSANIPESTFH